MSEQAATRRVADVIAETLWRYGVRYAFGIPGNDVLETIRAAEEIGIEFVLAKSEPAAAFMADAVYQLTQRPALLVPALGPGIANAISGIAGAMMERSAMLVLSGEMASGQHGIYTHQVFDHVALTTPVTKWAASLNPARAAQQVAKALDIALTPPAGPVLLNVAADASRAASREAGLPEPPALAPLGITEAALTEICAMVRRARRPLALFGLGALRPGVPESARHLVEAWQIPFLATYKAKGVIDERHRLGLGSLGLSPVVDAETLRMVREADLLILVGFDPIELRDGWLDAWPPELASLAIDWIPANHRVFPLTRQAVGDVAAILAALADRGEALSEWPRTRLAAHRAAVCEIVRPRRSSAGISPAALFGEVNAQATDDWIITVDVGAHRILANHVIDARTPGQLMQSNGLCCMGYAVPAAISAQIVHKDRPVVALVGDGCMLMTQGELALAVERELPIVVVVLNDSALSLIKLKQAKMQLAPRAVDFRAPRFDLIAAGFGATGVRVSTLGDFSRALSDAVTGRRPTVIDALIDPTEYAEQM